MDYALWISFLVEETELGDIHFYFIWYLVSGPMEFKLIELSMIVLTVFSVHC